MSNFNNPNAMAALAAAGFTFGGINNEPIHLMEKADMAIEEAQEVLHQANLAVDAACDKLHCAVMARRLLD